MKRQLKPAFLGYFSKYLDNSHNFLLFRMLTSRRIYNYQKFDAKLSNAKKKNGKNVPRWVFILWLAVHKPNTKDRQLSWHAGGGLLCVCSWERISSTSFSPMPHVSFPLAECLSKNFYCKYSCLSARCVPLVWPKC